MEISIELGLGPAGPTRVRTLRYTRVLGKPSQGSGPRGGLARPWIAREDRGGRCLSRALQEAGIPEEQQTACRCSRGLVSGGVGSTPTFYSLSSRSPPENLCGLTPVRLQRSPIQALGSGTGGAEFGPASPPVLPRFPPPPPLHFPSWEGTRGPLAAERPPAGFREDRGQGAPVSPPPPQHHDQAGQGWGRV